MTADIFCTEDQILDECVAFTDLLKKVYRDFGFTDIIYKVATRPEKRVGSDEAWDKAENALIESLKRSGCDYATVSGRSVRSTDRRSNIPCAMPSVVCGSAARSQVDFSMPMRLGAEYVAEDNTRKIPVMIHRAILGSLERFIGILIENHAGAMPLWLAPVHAVVLNISDGQSEYAKSVVETMKKAGFRVEADLRNEKITYKIRDHSVNKVPYLLVVGDKEKNGNTVAVRARGGVDLGVMTVDELMARMDNGIRAKQ